MLQPLQDSWPLLLSAAHPCMTSRISECIENRHCWPPHALIPGLPLAMPTPSLRQWRILLQRMKWLL